MLRYILTRLVAAIPTLFGVTVVVFALLYLMPGDPVRLLMGSSETGEVTEEVLSGLRAKFGLNDPIPVQFVTFVANAMQGDFGTSILRNQPVSELILDALPYTLRLALAAFITSIVIGVSLGVISASWKGSWVDRTAVLTSLVGVSVPDFWLAMLLIVLFAVHLGWFPAFGAESLMALVLPAFVLGIRQAAALARLTRASMLDALNKQYVTTARAKGLSEVKVVGVHALRNAFIPIVTLMGLELGRLIGGAVIIETVFARPGIGNLLMTAILDKDIPLFRGTILVVAIGYVIINLIVDLTYGWLDPRIRIS